MLQSALLFSDFFVLQFENNTDFSWHYEEIQVSLFINSLTFWNIETDFRSFKILEKCPLYGTIDRLEFYLQNVIGFLELKIAKQFLYL